MSEGRSHQSSAGAPTVANGHQADAAHVPQAGSGVLSIQQCYAGRHVLLTGGSGFLGKVWLSLVLDQLPNLGRVYVLLRPKASASAHRRFERMLNDSPAFQPLHERFGSDLSSYLAERVEVIEGDLEAPGMGLASGLASRLHRDLDLVVHCAGLVDFDPPLDKAVSANVDATLHVADFTEGCERARLLHISTAFVAGARYGSIAERLEPNYRPLGGEFDAVAELEAAREEVAEVRAQVGAFEQHSSSQASGEQASGEQASVGDLAQPLLINGAQPNRNVLRRLHRERSRQALQQAGLARAASHGFPNTYTYTKSLAESLLAERRSRLQLSVFRPSIVESALSYPFAGWNESFNGSAPLAYVMGSWFRTVPARPEAPFDVIPVDQVAAAMTTCGAALLSECASEVYQIGSSDRNRCSVGRAAELISLAHRKHYRQRERSRGERIVKSRWDAILTGPDHLFGVHGIRAGVDGARELMDLLPGKLRDRLQRLDERVQDMEGDLADIEKMVRLYRPFMYDSWYSFTCREIERHQVLEPIFRFEPESIDWRDYWLNVHMPGLRRWAFPLIEGKRPERYRAAHRTTLPPPPDDEVRLPELPSAPGLPRT